MVLAVEWAKQEELLDTGKKWYDVSWERGTVLSSKNRRLRWDYEFVTHKATKHRRPDLVWEYIDEKSIIVIDMACPQDNKVAEKEAEKRNKYQQLAYN